MATKHFIFSSIPGATPATVTVELWSDADSFGALLATIPNGDMIQTDADTFAVDLYAASVAGSLGLPGDAAHVEVWFLAFWKSDATTVITNHLVQGTRNRRQVDRSFAQPTVVYPTVAVPARGITAAVIAEGKPSYIKWDLEGSLNFGAPAQTFYETFFYDASGRTSVVVPGLVAPSP